MIDNVLELWKKISQKRNFDEKYYDIEEAKEIKKNLKLPLDKTIYSGLKVKEPSIEEFIKVFFEANSSFTAMMNDLLNMFEEIGAKQTDKNLEISFEFKKLEPYTVNLNKFKSEIKRLKSIEKEILILSNPSINEYLNLITELKKLNFSGKLDNEIIDYNKFDVSFTKTKNQDMNVLLENFKNIIKEINKYKTDKELLEEILNENDYEKFKIDNIPWLIVNSLKDLNEKFDDLEESYQQKCLSLLKNFINKMDLKKQKIIKKVEVFEEFLNLPFWKKRYELYSVWIFTLIYDVIKKYDYKIHVIDGRLIFPFKETHLATVYLEDNKNIFIYCEKKTPLSAPVGKSRKGHIQPDYSFFIEPLSNINSSILEIECKQYKKQSSDNFAKALIDYSNGRPNSKVFLVNYCDVDYISIEKKANKLINNFEKERCAVFGNINSKNNDKIDKLKKEIENNLFKSYIISENSKIKVRLTWGKEPNDLDLKCIYMGSISNTINYQNKSLNNIFFKEDVTLGYGPEEIEFSVHENATYKFQVEDYNKTKELKNSNAKIDFLIDDKLVKCLELNENLNEEDVWNVFIVNVEKMNEKEFKLNFLFEI